MSLEKLKQSMSEEHFARLDALQNEKLNEFVANAIDLFEPETVYVLNDSDEDRAYIRKQAVEKGEEIALGKKGHTCHFDGMNDQGRDKANTKYLLEEGNQLGESLNSIEREKGLAEVQSIMKGQMKGREMLVCFFTLGPKDSEFTIPCAQITDSPYVVHSEMLLYREGYEQFKKYAKDKGFFRFQHTEGELENCTSKNVDKRRVYIDLMANQVYSMNTQYAGNTVGLKKLALRLAIQKSSPEGWLAEHMFVMGVHGPNKRVSYFAGAFPSACGKTSTSMLPGQTIVGDDIAYFMKFDGEMRSVNVEKGIFGIIRDVNSEDDPIIYEALRGDCEVIFSNVLIDENKRPAWLGMGEEMPAKGINYSGEWTTGKTDEKGNEISPSHKNSRYCLSIYDLANCDPMIDDPKGVPVSGVIYGGRDSDTWVPVEEAFDWAEGIILKGASIESETTAATIGQEGVRTFNLMSNLDFLSIPLGRYIQNNLDFANGVENPPKIYSVNYFLKDENGDYLNGMSDKLVWILWAELRANGDVEGIETPTGIIPLYEDLAKLFKERLNQDYTQEDYVKQFTIRIPENLAKLDRVEKVYKEKVADAPQVLYDTFNRARARLQAVKEKYGDYISPFDLIAK